MFSTFSKFATFLIFFLDSDACGLVASHATLLALDRLRNRKPPRRTTTINIIIIIIIDTIIFFNRVDKRNFTIISDIKQYDER